MGKKMSTQPILPSIHLIAQEMERQILQTVPLNVPFPNIDPW